MNWIPDEAYKDPLKSIVACILETANPEKICLTGFMATKVQMDTIFADAVASWVDCTGYDLLILLGGVRRDDTDKLLDTIENRCRHIVPVTALIMAMEDFN